MKYKNNNHYRSLANIWYKDKHYQIFENDYHKLAFLIIDENNKYHYPELKDLIEVATEFVSNRNINVLAAKRRRKPKKFAFIPKAITITSIAAITSALLGTTEYFKDSGSLVDGIKDSIELVQDYTPEIDIKSLLPKKVETSNDPTFEQIPKEDKTDHMMVYPNPEENNTSENIEPTIESPVEIPIEEPVEEQPTEDIEEVEEPVDDRREVEIYDGPIKHEYQDTLVSKYLAGADDEYDYSWASDYAYMPNKGYYAIRDANAYGSLFGSTKPTYDDLMYALDQNNSISETYKNVIRDYIGNWLYLYPDTDFSNLCHNLYNLKVVEMSSEGIRNLEGSQYALACYVIDTNTICVRHGINPSNKNSDDYLTFCHELTHAARVGEYSINGQNVFISFNYNDEFGMYADESLVSNYACAVQGNGRRSDTYTLSSSYYRIIQDCLDSSFSGSDYMNHSINYLAQQMDNYMGDDGYGIHIISLIETQMAIQYNEHIRIGNDNFYELYDYITRMYMKKYLYEGMSYEEAEQVYYNLMNEINYNNEGKTKPFSDINEEIFRGSFNRCCVDLGIAKAISR